MAMRGSLTQLALARVLAEAGPIEDAVPRVLTSICEDTGCQVGELWRWDSAADALTCEVSCALPGFQADAFHAAAHPLALRYGQGLPGKILATGGPHWVADICSDPSFNRRALALDLGLRWAYGFPLWVHDRITGVVLLFSLTTQPQDPEIFEGIAQLGDTIGRFLEHKRAERALRESEARFRSLSESSPLGIFQTDARGHCLYTNPMLRRMLDLREEECLGEGWARALHPDDRDSIVADWREKVASGLETQRDSRCISASGEIRWIRVHAAPIRTDSGQIIGFVGTTEDITRRKLNEELLESENRILERVAEHAPLPEVLSGICRMIEHQVPGIACSILLLDEDGARLRHGAAPSLPESFGQLVDGLVIGPMAGACGTAAYRRQPVIISDLLLDPLSEKYRGLTERYGLRACFSTPIMSREGKVLGTFAIYYREPRVPGEQETELVQRGNHLARIALEQKHAEAALRLSEERNRRAFEDSAISKSVVSLDGRFMQVNRAYCEMLGYSEQELLGRDVYSITHAADRPLVREQMEAMLQSGRKSAQYEKRCMHKSGRIRWVRVTSSLVRDSSGAPSCFLGEVEDVTEKRQLEEHLRQTQKMEAIGRLAGGVAHDFNNHLTVVRGRSELLRREAADGGASMNHLAEIERAVESATSLVQQLLAFGRKQVLQIREVDLNAVVLGADRMLRRILGEQVRLVTVPDPHLGLVRADPAQMEQVVLNLAISARDATPQGGTLVLETANVELDEAFALTREGLRAGSYVLLAVSDTGEGMDEETRAHLFEPFYTAEPTGKGAGLGLASVYGIVRQSGGGIWVHSKPGWGTSFKIYFPRLDSVPRPPAEAPAAQEPEGVGCTETILLVEDDPAVRSVTRESLEIQGYRVLEAADGAEALERARSHPGEIHVLLTDLVMPGMPGTEVARELLAARPGLKVIYLSGYPQDAPALEGGLEPQSCFLSKPFSFSVLARSLRQVLSR